MAAGEESHTRLNATLSMKNRLPDAAWSTHEKQYRGRPVQDCLDSYFVPRFFWVGEKTVSITSV